MSTTATPARSLDKVLNLIDALNNEEFDRARSLLDDSVTFSGAMGTREGADVYMGDMRKMKLKYEVKKKFANEDEVCLIYNLTMSGKTIEGCGLYQLKDEKVKRIKAIFDPRPFL